MIPLEYIPASFAAAGTIVGALFTWLIMALWNKSERKVAHERFQAEQLRRQQSGQNLSKLQGQHNQLLDTEKNLREKQIQLEATLQEEIRTAKEKQRILENSESRLTDTFRALSAESLKATQDQFLVLAKDTLKTQHREASNEIEKRKYAVEDMVRPISRTLEKVQDQITASEKIRESDKESLKQQILHITESNQGLQRETHKLVKALRQPAGLGQWGEMQLRRVVEMAGMQEHCDFETQAPNPNPSIADEGRSLRPDLIVKLPGGKQIIVDSKAPMDAYLEAIESDTDHERDIALARHADQVRAHIQHLSSKAYQDQFTTTPEFVVFFLPSEAFFSAALAEEPSLIEKGVDQGVILATPTTLIALLRAVSFGWRQEVLAQNARQVSAIGRELYSHLGSFAGHVQQLGSNLNAAVGDYNKTVGSLETRILSGARKFEALGAATENQSIPQPQQIESLAREVQTAVTLSDTLPDSAPNNIPDTLPNSKIPVSLGINPDIDPDIGSAASDFRSALE